MTSNSNDAVLVVGDSFQGIAQGNGVQTVSEIIRLAEREPSKLPTTIIAGQGMSDGDLARLNAGTNISHLHKRPRIRTGDMSIPHRNICNKHQPQNVLLANLTKTGRLTARADLRIHRGNELIHDHQTGQHVQGIVAIEAARQMLIASSKLLRLTQGIAKPYFVLNTMSTTFDSFLFPLPAQLTYLSHEPDLSGGFHSLRLSYRDTTEWRSRMQDSSRVHSVSS